MATTLADLTYRVASELGIVREGVATGGSTTTIVDNVGRSEAIHYWKDGTAWILYDAAGAGALPQGQYSVISDYTASNYTVTLRTTLTAIAASDRYALAPKRFGLHDLIQAVNRTVLGIYIPTEDITTITTATNKSEYSLPLAADLDLRQVWMQTNTGDSDHNLWRELTAWYVQHAATGTADKLVFPVQPDEPYAIKLIYMSPHPQMVNYDDALNEMVYPKRVVYRSALNALLWYRDKTRSSEDWMMDGIRRMEQRAVETENAYPIRAPARAGKLMIVRDYVSYEEFEPNKVNLA